MLRKCVFLEPYCIPLTVRRNIESPGLWKMGNHFECVLTVDSSLGSRLLSNAELFFITTDRAQIQSLIWRKILVIKRKLIFLRSGIIFDIESVDYNRSISGQITLVLKYEYITFDSPIKNDHFRGIENVYWILLWSFVY